MASKTTSKPKLSLEQRVRKDPKLLARVLKNPGMRSKLPASLLPAAMRKQREINVRLKQPITPGSTMTERDLAHEADAATTTRYSPLDSAQRQALGEEQTRTRDVGGFYDQYLKQVAEHAQNVQAIGQQAAQVGLGTQNAVTGLAQTGLAGIQNPATADAAGRGAVAGDISGMASNAAAIRQALVGSFVAQQAGTNAAASGLADTTAHVVAPGQKLGAQMMAQGRVRQAQTAIKDTAREKGAFNEKYRADKRADEGKNVLAKMTLSSDIANQRADNANQAKTTTETARHHQAQETAAERRAREKRESNATKAKTPNQWGVPADQWNRWSTEHRQRVMDAQKAKGGKGKTGKGPDWAAPGQSGKAMTQVSQLQGYAQKARDGLKFEPTGKEKGPDPKARLDRNAARAKIQQYAGNKLMSPALLDAAVDAVYGNGVLSASTVRALITAGYKPSQVASTLHAKTAGQVPSYEDRIKRNEVAGPPAPKKK